MIEAVIPVREVSLVGDMKVKRILPFRTKRMVGPFTFLDHMGPLPLRPGHQGDVPPHPHIGLSTVTYLFEGSLVHRDSLGTVQEIRPGDVNWMTAGRGIVHSERNPATQRQGDSVLEGLQAWVALPVEEEETNPSFEHYESQKMPSFAVDQVQIKLIAGQAFGYRSPVKTHSKLFYFECKFPEGSSLRFQPQGQEAAVYIVRGELSAQGKNLQGPTFAVFEQGKDIEVSAKEETHAVFLGGEALEGPRFIFWNFVSSSKERLEEAKRDWKEQKFPRIPEETEFVPLPEDPKAQEKSTLP